MADALGRAASFTWSGAPAITGGTIHGFLMQGGPRIILHDTTRFGDTGERFEGSFVTGDMDIATFVPSDGTVAPAIPTGATGTLTVTLFGSETWTITAIVEAVNWRAQSNSGSPPQVAGYRMRFGGSGLAPVTASS